MGKEYEVNFEKLLNPYERSNWIRPAINFPVQSAGSDYVICGLIEIINTPKLKNKVKVCATVHDSVIALVKEDKSFADTIQTMQNIMEHPRLAQQCLTTAIDIPIVVDVEIGPLGKGVSLDEYTKEKTL
jgi:DNA polymerase I-like protein with 3'-5' exonuclease and polymerase domains